MCKDIGVHVPILVILATDNDGRIDSGMGSHIQTELLAEFAYNMPFTKTKILMKIHLSDT